MSDPIVQLASSDFEDAMDFLNLVFSVYEPHDFERLIPKAYKPTDESMACNYAIKRDGRIRAIVGIFPFELMVGDTTLRIAGIGGVSVHPRDRGQGHMKRLMNHCLGVIHESHYDLSWLGGQRQRYGYFGYEVCGVLHQFEVNKDNLRHAVPSLPDIRFHRITSADDARLPQVLSLHDKAPIKGVRTAGEFYDIAVTWHHDLFVAEDSNHSVVGYCVVDLKSHMVFELVGDSDQITREMIWAWVHQEQSNSVKFEVPSIPGVLASELSAIGEEAIVRSCGNWQIFDWGRVLDTLMRLRHATTGLVPGDVRLGIKGHGTLHLSVDGAGARCASTDAEPEVTLSPTQAMKQLFGPLPYSAAAQTNHIILDSWCPLPLFMPRQEEV